MDEPKRPICIFSAGASSCSRYCFVSACSPVASTAFAVRANLASRFIQEEEQLKLLQHRQEMQLRVIPIIVHPCKWQSEPVLKDIQALPRDNKAVIKFKKATGDRDQVWSDIATVIEKRAKAKSTS